MNIFEIERSLAENGFNAKDISALRMQAEKSGTTYPALLKELSLRFIASMLLVIILAIVWIYTLMYKDSLAITSYSITMLIIAPIFYIFTPMKLGYKSFLYTRKK
ncbi:MULTISPECIES: hypothetical protein [Pantoea]|uniref:hypothetical protein n=1 Tax=Pantoea TaxID=53335 RepID=UPI00083DC5A2|nr:MULTISPECIES: hypothetical protein [Pantoea]AOE38662.1 hypothetical protein BEE12_01440 [Pantoea agglomerans]MBB1227737.1 hypothetical protein [Pantoea pleuroti]OQV41945.1 hypothetical protein BZ160_09225 [Pantoea vagans]UJL36160.1 hypothetical protein JK642_13540 [Pantoea agglomerans]WNK67993.1 hypothetical protein RM156_05795 [Pantoea agglomerans]